MRSRAILPTITAATLVLAACGSDDGGGDADMADAVETYAEGVEASYEASVESAEAMDEAIDTFVDDPTEENLESAKQAWLDARDDYGPTEAFRFYGGPIDNEEDGPEGLINAWPMDEAYVDYVEGSPDSGIINDPETYPTIDGELLESLNEDGGETNISTGWHAIEFLLWGQDLSDDGPGARPATDYSDAENADRRAEYLTTASELLVGHLEDLEAAWDEDGDNYRAEFVALDPEEAMTNIITGIGELSRGELAGERMNVAYSERSQEDEHSCFSDNTTADIVANATGIQMVLTASYPGGVEGTSVLDVISAEDSELAEQLAEQVDVSVAAVTAIPAPFDQHLADGVPDDDPGRATVLVGIEALEAQTPTIVSAAEALGLTINVT
ncbi:imelysin family protein [Ilumatobacter nonamiensis]|uniref:imelysin family protein n=1 Tax=Ilumatobacter nonamiensis TaxID=467093 RepID=UPI00034B0396|nr:imelysin family protein [Ilumatobacter nonamiensis]